MTPFSRINNAKSPLEMDEYTIPEGRVNVSGKSEEQIRQERQQEDAEEAARRAEEARPKTRAENIERAKKSGAFDAARLNFNQQFRDKAHMDESGRIGMMRKRVRDMDRKVELSGHQTTKRKSGRSYHSEERVAERQLRRRERYGRGGNV